uniref:RanBD1 domain-containing protein n=1 Tax=Panagrolaimus sp. ES5 TaxID=591445 RepID=A0AC34GGK3_9BILA
SDEEIEDQLFKGECKLYNYCCVTKQSSEIGMGDIFVLYNFKKNLYQVCMRRHRDQKICAYLKIREDTILNDKKGCKSSGVLQCQDFSEGESKPAIFIVRFREKDVYDEFKKIFDDATENVRMSLINGGTVDECSRKLKEAKQTGVPFKRQRTPQSCNTIDDSFMSVASATFKAPATPPKSFATFTSVNAETCFSSQFPSATKAASAHVLPPRRPENVANVSNTTLKSHYADDEPVAVPVEPRNAFANLSQQKLDESVATLSTNQYANVNEPQNIALTFDLIELSP